jgi:hypothetical protein
MPVKTQVQLTVPVNDLIHPEVSVIDSVVMRACRKLDVACAMPISNTIHPDGTGSAVFTVPGGFDGYIEVNPAVNPPAYIPTLIFVSAPLVDDTTLTRSGFHRRHHRSHPWRRLLPGGGLQPDARPGNRRDAGPRGPRHQTFLRCKRVAHANR